MAFPRSQRLYTALATAVACAFANSCGGSGAGATAPGPYIPFEKSVQKFAPAATITRRELLFRLDREARSGHPNRDLELALRVQPHEIEWTANFTSGRTVYAPIVPARARVIRRLKVDLVVFGGELEGVSTAIAAANRGKTVAIVADGPLGGISSDTGANLRYIDGIASVPRTPAQIELYRAMNVRGSVAIPDGVDAHIAGLLASRYAGKVTLVRTETLDHLWVREGSRIDSVRTGEGVEIIASKYLDMDPECRVGELARLPETISTPNLAYGLVFDLLHLRPNDYVALRSQERLAPPKILHWLGLTERQMKAAPTAAASRARLVENLKHNVLFWYENSSFGYKALAEGFDFSMQCRAIRDHAIWDGHANRDADPGLVWLNACRLSTGFNISHLGQEANLNSISYCLNETILQNDHSIRSEPRLRPILTTERDGLTAYFRYVTGNAKLQVRIPNQFYVRRATAAFSTLKSYVAGDFLTASPSGKVLGKTSTPKGVASKWWMAYQMDFRGVTPRDSYDLDLLHGLQKLGGGLRRWTCRPETCSTQIPNLYILNKCSAPPAFSGGLRIVQNLINTGQAWVEKEFRLGLAALPRIGGFA